MRLTKIGFFLSLRTISFGISFLLTVLIFYFLGSNNLLINASPWWPIYGLLANIICCIFLRKEKVNFREIINFKSDKLKKDLLLGLLFIFLSMIIAVSSSIGFGVLLYGRFPNELMLSFKDIPTILIILGIILFPVINSVLEEIIYNGYIFPILELKLKNTLFAILVVLFFFTIQHVFITFKPDLKYLIWRLLSFVPLLFFWIVIFVKMRRLTTLFLVHWFMDTFAILSIVFGTK